MKRNRKEYDAGKIKKLWPFLVELHKNRPGVFENAEILRRNVAVPWPALDQPKHCPNCGGSMEIYIVRIDYHKAQLLLSMGEIVLKRLNDGIPFTEANAVHVVSMNATDSIRHSTTQARTLGLIAKISTADGKHDRKKGWLITRRGFQFLANKPVPASVQVFHNKIEERTDDTTTLSEILSSSGDRTNTEPERYYEIAGIKGETIL